MKELEQSWVQNLNNLTLKGYIFLQECDWHNYSLLNHMLIDSWNGIYHTFLPSFKTKKYLKYISQIRRSGIHLWAPNAYNRQMARKVSYWPKLGWCASANLYHCIGKCSLYVFLRWMMYATVCLYSGIHQRLTSEVYIGNTPGL